MLRNHYDYMKGSKYLNKGIKRMKMKGMIMRGGIIILNMKDHIQIWMSLLSLKGETES